jgi:Uma2 family endonuclease
MVIATVTTEEWVAEQGASLKKNNSTFTLILPAEIYLHVTPVQFEALARVNRDLRLERNAKGELIVSPPTGWETGKRNFSLIGQLYCWCEENISSGEAFESSTGFILPNGANRSPDISWISSTRWNALTTEQKGTFPNICPDFIVEIRSASDNLAPLQEKMREYLENGAVLGWLIDPKNRQVEIYRIDQEVEILKNPLELNGENLLPGFVVNLQKIWPA